MEQAKMNQKPNTYIVDPHTTANLKTVIVCQNKGIDHTWSHHQKVNNPNPLPYTRSQNNIPYQACWCLNPWLTVPASCLANASSRHPHPRGPAAACSPELSPPDTPGSGSALALSACSHNPFPQSRNRNMKIHLKEVVV